MQQNSQTSSARNFISLSRCTRNFIFVACHT
nr:MAG TPA_asm: hypothetical protein [Caudoviricetes sp.]